MIYHISYIDTVRHRNNYQLSGAYDGEEGLFMAPLYFICAAITAASMATAQIVAALHVCQVSFSKAPHCAGTEFKKNGHKKNTDNFLENSLKFVLFCWNVPVYYFPLEIKIDLNSVPAQCGATIEKMLNSQSIKRKISIFSELSQIWKIL